MRQLVIKAICDNWASGLCDGLTNACYRLAYNVFQTPEDYANDVWLVEGWTISAKVVDDNFQSLLASLDDETLFILLDMQLAQKYC